MSDATGDKSVSAVRQSIGGFDRDTSSADRVWLRLDPASVHRSRSLVLRLEPI